MWLGQESFLAAEDLQSDEDRIKDAGDLDLDDPEPQNTQIFDGNNGDSSSGDGGSGGTITIKDGDDTTQPTDDSSSNTDDKTDSPDDTITINDAKNGRLVRSSRMMDDGFNNLL